MIHTFRMKIVSKRQITVPQELLDYLHIREGDYLEFIAEDGKEVRVSALRLAPTDFFSEKVLSKLDQRERDLDKGGKEVRDLSSLPTKRPREMKAGHGRS